MEEVFRQAASKPVYNSYNHNIRRRVPGVLYSRRGLYGEMEGK